MIEVLGNSNERGTRAGTRSNRTRCEPEFALARSGTCVRVSLARGGFMDGAAGTVPPHARDADGGDSRFDEVKTQPGKFLVYWTLQGVWVWVTALPVFLINGIGRQSPLFWGDYLSLALWVAGFICETTADYQKYKFKQDPANKGRFINTGLVEPEPPPQLLRRDPDVVGGGRSGGVDERLAPGVGGGAGQPSLRHVLAHAGERGADLGEDRGREVGQRGGVPELQEEHAVPDTETSRHGPGRLSRTAKNPVNLGVADGWVKCWSAELEKTGCGKCVNRGKETWFTLPPSTRRQFAALRAML
eukprot:CAMPEP_0181383992 /NCGR_PEP_ID=MMETSP1106-20121128/21698_1 /TAXON_ID=81844 /ORGANISM="Mantoniella antarctica, Strain SL-175" /LENGTH=301 /DNA_ID=CAMNT_0023503775 /DNA_START=243 /DNA_END=1149 /DNA_ORIENTATION=+